MVSRKKFSRVERLSIHESTRTTSNICYMAPTHHPLDPSFLLLTLPPPPPSSYAHDILSLFPRVSATMPQENPTDFPGFLETTDRKEVSNPPPTPSILKTSSVLSSIQNYSHWLPFESNFALTSPLISLQRVRSVYLNYMADEALMFPFFKQLLFFFILIWYYSHKFEQFSFHND